MGSCGCRCGYPCCTVLKCVSGGGVPSVHRGPPTLTVQSHAQHILPLLISPSPLSGALPTHPQDNACITYVIRSKSPQRRERSLWPSKARCVRAKSDTEPSLQHRIQTRSPAWLQFQKLSQTANSMHTARAHGVQARYGELPPP